MGPPRRKRPSRTMRSITPHAAAAALSSIRSAHNRPALVAVYIVIYILCYKNGVAIHVKTTNLNVCIIVLFEHPIWLV